MSLINCPECNRQVSDQANSCPNCGFQIANYFNQKERELKQIEQQEKLNKKIAEQEKRKQLWINRFKKHKKKYILISSILNYSRTSGTASANGCALSDSCKVDNLHSFPPGKGYTTPLVFQFFFERGFEAVKVHRVTVIRVLD